MLSDLFSISLLVLVLVVSHVIPFCLAEGQLADDVVEWVRSQKGYFSDKLEIRRMDASDPKSPFGIFAEEDLDAGETIMQIPRECYIYIFDDTRGTHKNDSMDATTTEYNANLCRLAQRTMKEMKLDDKSMYAPYVRYLNNQSRRQLPATWSEKSKALLRDLFPPDDDGVDWIDFDFKGGCFEFNDPFEEHVVALIKQRGYDTALIPLWDMVNHDNGKINTDNTSMYDKDGIRVWSSNEIKKGEEIFASYDKCMDCSDISTYWGTKEILRDFGFVEPYPRRVIYYDEDIWFEVWEGAGGEKEVRWDDYGIDKDSEEYDADGDFDGSPGRSGVNFLRKELKRIDGMPPHDEDKCSADVPLFECSMILQYKSAVTEALSLAVDNAESMLARNEEL